MSNVVKSAVVAAMVVAGLSAPRQAAAYSVLVSAGGALGLNCVPEVIPKGMTEG